MITTNILGQILGLTFLIVSLSILVKPKNALDVLDRLTNNISLAWLYGYLATATGAVLLAFSNFNTKLSTIITILGILSLLKGISFLFAPRRSANFNLRIIKNKVTSLRVAGACLLAISLILLISSF